MSDIFHMLDDQPGKGSKKPEPKKEDPIKEQMQRQVEIPKDAGINKEGQKNLTLSTQQFKQKL